MRALNIRCRKHLCLLLGTSERELRFLCERPELHYYRKDRIKSGKTRQTATPVGRLRILQERFLRHLQKIELPPEVHGARKGRSYITNACAHSRRKVVVKADLSSFFPNVSDRRVLGALIALGCSDDVARTLTQLTTLDGCLPQGAPASGLLAVIAAVPLAKRLAGFARSMNATYTQYIDDITISGASPVMGAAHGIRRIAEQEGFSVNEGKADILGPDVEHVITGVRVEHGVDAPSSAIAAARHRVDNLARLNRTEVEREVLSIRGKIRQISYLNRGAGRSLGQRLRRRLASLDLDCSPTVQPVVV